MYTASKPLKTLLVEHQNNTFDHNTESTKLIINKVLCKMSSLMSFCPSCAFCLAVGAIVALILSRNAFLMANIKEKINGIKHKIMNGDRYDKIKRQARQNPWFGKENPVCIVTGSNSGMV